MHFDHVDDGLSETRYRHGWVYHEDHGGNWVANMESSTLDAFEVMISWIQMQESLAKACDEILVMWLTRNPSSIYIQMNHMIRVWHKYHTLDVNSWEHQWMKDYINLVVVAERFHEEGSLDETRLSPGSMQV